LPSQGSDPRPAAASELPPVDECCPVDEAVCEAAEGVAPVAPGVVEEVVGTEVLEARGVWCSAPTICWLEVVLEMGADL
jgi:hypothetical protein